MKFRELFENVKEKEFKTKINGVEYSIIRHYHVRSPRKNSNIPRDSGLSKQKYQIILERGLNYIDASKPFTLTWESNAKNNAISAEFISEKEISIFSAIMKQDKAPEKLFVQYTNRYHIGIL